jgi:hypothetical protein
MPRAVMLGEEILGPRISKGELTNRLTDITRPSRGSDPKACHAMDQGNTTKRCIKWTKFDIGFKMAERSLATRLSNKGQLGRV